MKYLTLILFLCCTHISFAQCDTHRKTDDFNGVTTTWTNKVKLTFGGVPTLLKSAGDRGCTYRVYFRLVDHNGKTSISISENTDNCFCWAIRVSFKFNNGTVITKNNYRKGQEIKTPLGYEKYIFFDILDKELATFSNSLIDKFRIVEFSCADHPVIEERLDKKTARKINGVASCMLHTLDNN